MSRRIINEVAMAAAVLAAVSMPFSAALADQTSTPLPDGHAPAGVMADHLHKAGEGMVGYRYSYGRSAGDLLSGRDSVSDAFVVDNGCAFPGQSPSGPASNKCSAAPKSMTMQMHMLDIMYAPIDGLTLMVMPMWMSHEMDMRELAGGGSHHGGGGHHGGGHGAHDHGTDGIGDTTFGALMQLSKGPGYSLHLGTMISAPTGSVNSKTDGVFDHYHMQIGSGTWDLLPSLTYVGRVGRMSWGGQISAIVRMERENESGYRLGDVFQATAWGSYRLNDWLSVSLRGIHSNQGAIEGHYDGPHSHSAPPDLQRNYGGRFWDVGIGVNMVVPEGSLKGHRLSVEWLEPVGDDVNGIQLERDGTLIVNWSKAF